MCDGRAYKCCSLLRMESFDRSDGGLMIPKGTDSGGGFKFCVRVGLKAMALRVQSYFVLLITLSKANTITLL